MARPLILFVISHIMNIHYFLNNLVQRTSNAFRRMSKRELGDDVKYYDADDGAKNIGEVVIPSSPIYVQSD